MRAYIRVDPNLPDAKEHYPDGALAAFTLTLCLAEHQGWRGRFRNRKLLAALLGRRARWIPYLIEHGDLVEAENGVLYFEGWDEWQEGDWKVGERVKRIRERRAVTATVTDCVTPTVITPSEPLAVSGKHIAVSGRQAGLVFKKTGTLRGGETTPLSASLPVVVR